MFTVFLAFWRRLLNDLGLRRSAFQAYHLEAELERSLQALAERERRSKEEIAVDLISLGLAHRQASAVYEERWDQLTDRERQVTALVCKGYTNRQIAVILILSPETVKTHVRNSLAKFGLRTKEDLCLALEDWDLSGWIPLLK